MNECKGLPLALKVIGASLRGQSEMFWASAKNRLSRGEPICESHEINLLERMAMSINSLPNKVRECFLDLGAFPEDKKIPLDVLINMRKNRIKTPVLMLTAKAELEDRVAGLDAGADDYLPKPFATSELIARVKALGRRSENYNDTVQETGNLILDGNRYEMKVGEKAVSLTNKEYQLMELFVTHPGFVFSTDHLMEKIWGLDTDSEVDVVWTTIGYVRKKLRSIDADVEIKTIRGAGYSLEVITC